MAVLKLLMATSTKRGPIVMTAVIIKSLAFLILAGFLDITYANRIINATLATSDGWKDTGPM